MKKEIRIGFVSSVNYEKGMIKVTYPDMDDEVTREMPVMTPFADEYFMPRVDDAVFVLHLSNGSEYAIVAGWWWDEEHPPHEYGEEFYRKDFDHSEEARLCYNKNKNKVMVLTLPKNFVIHAPGGITLDAPTVHCTGLMAADGDVIANDTISLAGHTHATTDGAKALPPDATCSFSGGEPEEC